jgi:hypothetical protein
MNLERLDKYVFVSGIDKPEYEFYSRGPNKIIRKLVVYDRVVQINKDLYNLSFGDWNQRTGRIDDHVVSNNGDRKKVLATVAATVVHFTAKNPEAIILVFGSTSSRTRLYQMSIALYFEEIAALFEVSGFFENAWETFQKGRNYTGFLIILKKN